jgi:hypothetical protein
MMINVGQRKTEQARGDGAGNVEPGLESNVRSVAAMTCTGR